MTPNEVESLKAELYPVSYKAVAFGEHFYSFNSDSSHVYTLQSSFVQAGKEIYKAEYIYNTNYVVAVEIDPT